MRLLILVVLLILSYSIVSAQEKDSLNYGPEPQGGTTKLALSYFKINFTRTQRLLLSRELELIYSVDEFGKPFLEKVNGVMDDAIIDSLIQTTNSLPLFKPRLVNGIPVGSIYFLTLTFPKYGQPERVHVNQGGPARLSDYEDIELGAGFEMLIGGMVNTFSGSAQDYLGTGGGMKVDMIFMAKRKFGIGMDMSFYGNNLKKNYPIASTRKQIAAPPTLFLGLACQWIVNQKERREISIQIEANYVQQNVSARIDSYDNDWDLFSGFSPGILAHYRIKLGRDQLSSYYWSPVVLTHWLNLHVGIRPLLYNSALPSGVMMEAGISYRMKTNQIKSYKLKNETDYNH